MRGPSNYDERASFDLHELIGSLGVGKENRGRGLDEKSNYADNLIQDERKATTLRDSS